MSISSRITEIEQHIGNAYDKIEDLGIDLTDVDKNINNISAMLENVWDEYPKVSATDVEEASLNGTKKGRINIDLKGNTEQDTLTGKNLLDISKVISSTNDNVINNGDGTLKVKGYGVSSGSPNNLKTYCPTLQVGDEVIISADTTSSNKFIYLSGTNTSWAFGTTRTITQSDLDSIVLWYGASGGDTNYYTISNIMVRKSIVTDSSYEPYCGGIPSPSPDFPQQIKNVTGNANIKIQNKNLLNIADGNTLTTKSFDITDFVEVGKTYSFSAYLDLKNTTSTAQARLRIDKYIGTEVSYLGGTLIANKSKGISKRENVTLESSLTKVVLTIQSYGVADFNCDYSQIMVEQGSTATSYVEHQEQNYPFSLKSKNLVDIPDKTLNSSGYIYNGTIDLKAGKYTLSIGESSQDSFSIAIIGKSGTLVSGSITLPYTFTINENGTSMRLYSPGAGTFKNIMIEEGTTATDYEPYYDIKAMEGTTLQDDGIHQKRKHFVLDGTENWQIQANKEHTFKLLLNEISNSGLCTHYQNIASSEFDGKTGIYLIYTNSIIISDLRFSSVADFKSWLLQQYNNETPVEVEYVIRNDEEIIPYKGVQQSQYNAIKQAKSYNDQTNISQTNDELPFILDIEALKGGN